MLDTATKRRIDDCRDILVGKLPDPKAQIEQITIALIYKFMDDMDRESIELGGKAKFFSGVYKKYGWDSLFNAKVTAAEMLKLYSEAIAGMDKNPNIPQLFRDIFKNAFLPYRDPETLKLFLKTIGEFEYTHSEKLGDAFEYLLSVMGSQGDAGQFRTPRHIIDFLVTIVDPQKNETILDPACGTAGFLISAFKHIKEQNKKGLTPDERKKLIRNFIGYDISPDMVRLSLANLYLHGFSDPHIWEYDTLSSEERWDETFDVVLANPPFMSPKGGIRPHKKFSISSNRSEVLFVDYIAEHLNPKGRAGIIVPEGVIFQSGTAYKDLRKMLVDNSLYAVVSLPAGVFNPYSGVKTSILLMDAAFAKKSNEILFVKIDNDGYGLGAQRNAVKGGQLEEAVEILQRFKRGNFSESSMAHAVSKIEIAKNGDYSLSGERFKKGQTHSSNYKFVNLGEVAKFQQGTQVDKEEQLPEPREGYERFIRIVDYTQKNEDIRYVEKKDSNSRCKIDDIIMVRYGEVGFVGRGIEGVYANNLFSVEPIIKDLSKEYLFCVFKSEPFKTFIDKVVLKSSLPAISHKVLKDFEFPLPPLFIQEEIVAEIEGYQKIIDGAKAVVENYKPKIDIDPDWEMVELGEVADLLGGGTPSKQVTEYWDNGNVDWVSCSDFTSNSLFLPDSLRKITKEGLENSSSNLIEKDTLILVTRVSLGKMAFTSKPTAINQDLTAIKFTSKKINKFFIYYFFLSIADKIESDGNGITVKGVTRDYVKRINVPIPSIETQHQIVSRIEKEQCLVDSNKQLIEIFEQKIKERIAKVWSAKENVSLLIRDTVVKSTQPVKHKYTVARSKPSLPKSTKKLYTGMLISLTYKELGVNYGEVGLQKNTFNVSHFYPTKAPKMYEVINSNFGTYAPELTEDLKANPFLEKERVKGGEVFKVLSSKKKELQQAIALPEHQDYITAVKKTLKIYKDPFINKETDKIELLNTVAKLIIDLHTIDIEKIYQGMKLWKIKQNGFNTKADKFNKGDTQKMIKLIEREGLLESLLMN